MFYSNTKLNILKLKLKCDKGKMLAALILFSLVSSVSWAFLPAGTMAETGSNPRFNIFTPYTHTQTYNKDYFLLDIKNETQNSDWNTSASANAGDTLVFSVYYHNGVNETTAINTKLKVALPTNNGTSLTSTGYLWADNAENATASNPLTQTATINVSSSQSLNYISGSAKWYPNQADWRTDSATSWPFGQNGDEIISSSGINIGDIQGCWEFSGYVIFKVKIGNTQPVLNPDLSIYKTARNITANESSWHKSTSANSNDRIAFSLKISSTGDNSLNNIRVSDTLPSQLSYVNGSTRVDGNYISDGITSGGINIGNISTGNYKTITFETIVSSGIYSTTLTNYAYASADNVSQKNDTAQVIVNYNVPNNQPGLTLRKTLENSTSPNGNDTSNTASPGDTLKYTLTYRNTGNTTLTNARITDNLPAYLSVLSVDNGVYDKQTNQITWNIGTISSGNSGTVLFRAKVLTPLSSITITNYGVAKADSISDVISNSVYTSVNIVINAAPIKVVTGGSDIFKTGATAVGFSALALFFIYLALQNMNWFTRARLNGCSLTVRFKEKLLQI